MNSFIRTSSALSEGKYVALLLGEPLSENETIVLQDTLRTRYSERIIISYGQLIDCLSTIWTARRLSPEALKRAGLHSLP